MGRLNDNTVMSLIDFPAFPPLPSFPIESLDGRKKERKKEKKVKQEIYRQVMEKKKGL